MSHRDVTNAMADHWKAEHDRIEAQRDQLREALECWPLKELMVRAEDSGDAQTRKRLLWFSEIRDAALKETEES